MSTETYEVKKLRNKTKIKLWNKFEKPLFVCESHCRNTFKPYSTGIKFQVLKKWMSENLSNTLYIYNLCWTILCMSTF